MTVSTPPRVLTVAGSDSGGGAGIQADLKTMLALGVHGMSVIAAVTAQNSARRPGLLGAAAGGGAGPARLGARRHRRPGGQDRACWPRRRWSRPSPRCSAATPRPSWSTRSACPSTATRCSRPRPWTTLRTRLLPVATVVTPNLWEVEQLTAVKVEDERDLRRAAEAVLALGPTWALIKGGHLPGRARRPAHRRRAGAPLRAPTPRQPAHPRHRLHPRLGHRLPPRAGRGRARQPSARPRSTSRARSRTGFPLGAGIGPVDHAWRWR